MPRRYVVGGESRLSLEGLRGRRWDRRAVIVSIFAHQSKSDNRIVHLSDGRIVSVPKWKLIGLLLSEKGYEVDSRTTEEMYG